MSCQILFDNPTGVFSPGNTVSGKVVCFFNESKDIKGIRLRFRGREQVSWTKNENYYDSESHSTRRRNMDYRGDNKFITNQVNVTGEGTLGPGQFEYPFQFVLPPDCPGSFKSTHGSIWYYLKATVDIPYVPDYDQVVELTVVAPVDFNYMSNIVMAPSHYEDEKSVCCWCCTNGPINLDVDLDRSAYVLGETMRIRAHVVNMSRVTVKALTAALKMTIKETVTSPKHDSRYTEELVAAVYESGVAAHGDKYYDLNLVIPEGFVLPNFNMCSLFEKWFTLKVDLELPKCHSNMDVKPGITLGHIPLRGVEISQTAVVQNSAYPVTTPSVDKYPFPCSPGDAVPAPYCEFPEGQDHLGFSKDGFPGDVAPYQVKLTEDNPDPVEPTAVRKPGRKRGGIQSHGTRYIEGNLTVAAPYPLDSPGFPQPEGEIPENAFVKPTNSYRPPSPPRSNVSAPYPTPLAPTTPNPHYQPQEGAPQVQEPLPMPTPSSGPILPPHPIGLPGDNFLSQSASTNAAMIGEYGSSNGSVQSSHQGAVEKYQHVPVLYDITESKY